MQGNLSQIPLTDLLLLATSGRKSGVLKLAHGKESVEVFLSEGKIVHATCPIGEGDKALLYPVTWGEGTEDEMCLAFLGVTFDNENLLFGLGGLF